MIEGADLPARLNPHNVTISSIMYMHYHVGVICLICIYVYALHILDKDLCISVQGYTIYQI